MVTKLFLHLEVAVGRTSWRHNDVMGPEMGISLDPPPFRLAEALSSSQISRYMAQIRRPFLDFPPFFFGTDEVGVVNDFEII